MAATVMVFDTLGYSKDHPDLVIAKRAVRKLLADNGDFAYCQPCVSPVWDTVLTCHALMEAGATRATPTVRRALDWIAERQVLEVVGDWARARPGLRPGGWAFEYRNDHYPDVDNTAVDPLRAAPRRPGALSECDRARRRMGARHAMRQRRLGVVRCRQHPLPPEQHPLRRPRRSARPADRRPDRPLHQRARPARLWARPCGGGAGARISPARSGARRLVVRPLGDQLHLRHLVGAVCAERRRRGHARSPMCRRRSSG